MAALPEQVRKSLREQLRRSGLTQAEIATRMGTTQSHISQILNGPRVPGLDLLERLAGAMGCTVQLELRQAREKISA